MNQFIEFQFDSNQLPIAGIDEVGRGCLAGPVVACAAILDIPKIKASGVKVETIIKDSKKLSLKQREVAKAFILEHCVDFHIAQASPREIEEINILEATFLAMRRAASQLKHTPRKTLVDGNKEIPGYPGAQEAIVKGDTHSVSIAAASILAKIHRDELMQATAQKYPAYGFDQHVGYGTKKHIEAINTVGICPEHRRTFAPINKLF